MKTVAEYQLKVSRLAGRARRRILSGEDVIQVLYEARRSRYGQACGGHVANAYNYPAETMRMAAFRVDHLDAYAIRTDWGNAKKHCSDVPIYGGRRPLEKFIERAQGLTADKIESEGWDLIPQRAARRVIAERRLKARRNAEAQWPASEAPESLVVSIQDSLDSGNCKAETCRIAAWFDSATVSASELRATILRREPELAWHAKRAIQQAERRVKA